MTKERLRAEIRRILDECSLDEIRGAFKSLWETTADEPLQGASFPQRFGPTEPSNDTVICPACTSQFVAIPVNVQTRLAAAESALAEADRRYRARHGNLMYADVLSALAGDLTSGTEHELKSGASHD